jgi:isocitrate dehydrogenase
MFMSKKALLDFYEEQIEDARKTGVMFCCTSRRR